MLLCTLKEVKRAHKKISLGKRYCDGRFTPCPTLPRNHVTDFCS